MQSLSNSWMPALKNRQFRDRLVFGLIILIILLGTLPFFFQIIQQREGGYQIKDSVLNWLTPRDLSIPTFIILWFTAMLTIYRCFRNPQLFILFLWGFILLGLSRMVTISLVHLNPPEHLVQLIDPINNTFYGATIVTKDLFFSGHTASQFLMFLCLTRKSDKILTLLSTVAIGIMVLMQHVHYTLDVIAAPIFTYWIYLLAKKITTIS